MSRLVKVGLLAASAAVAACQKVPPPASAAPKVVIEEAEAWRGIASARDSAALDGLAARWRQALAAGRSANLSRRISAEGPLLVPEARLARAAPAPGSYRCRYVRPGGRKWVSSAQGFCYIGVEAGQLSLATELRGLRLGGYLWELKGGEGLVFLGGAVPAGAATARAYGEEPARDAAGLVERIGEFRYRLVLPEPSPGSGLTVVELVAAPRA
ncbi:MAG TPA: DUF4893 domain-containing protein [Allosphingosinicella sp.]|jgi:hypothetical protein|nr:DUF4893 domain-containing protein [Allosphingosinicella sp.]